MSAMRLARVELKDWIGLEELPTSRRLYALRRMLEVVEGLAIEDVGALLRVAIKGDEETAAQEHSRKAERRSKPEAKQLDLEMGRMLSGFSDLLEGQMKIYGAESVLGSAAGEILWDIFPEGVEEVTKLSCIQEHEAIKRLLLRLRPEGDLGMFIGTLGCQGVVAQLALRNAEYGAALDVNGLDGLTHEDMVAMRAAGQARLLQIVAILLGRFHGEEEEVRATRDELLWPVLKQSEIMREIYRNRRQGGEWAPGTVRVEDEALLAEVFEPESV